MIAPIAKERTKEWHQVRSTGVGASEAAAACGISRWETQLDLWSRKTGRTEKQTTDAMMLGTLMEPAIREFFAQKTGIEVIEASPGVYRHPDVPCVLASPDARLADGTLGEFKRTGGHVYSSEELGASGTDEVPIEWFTQAQQQMAVCDAPAVRFGVLVDARELRTYLVDRDQNIIDKIIERDIEFWRCVESDTAPDVDWNHKRSCDAARAAFRNISDGGEVIELDDSDLHIWEAYRHFCDQESEAKRYKDLLMADLFVRVGESAGGSLPNGSVLKKIVVQESPVAAYVRKSYSYLKEVRAKR